MLRQAARALKPGGRLVLDFLNTEKAIRTLVPFEVKHEQALRFVIARRLEDGFIVKDIHVMDGNLGQRFQERVQALVLADFLAYLRKTGLQVQHVFGSYALCPFDAVTSDRLIVVAQRPAS